MHFPARSERLLVLVIGAVQFINVLDFVMVIPLAPDFTRNLGIASSSVPLVASAYTLAAAFSGLAGSVFLDRFDRRSALGIAMAGLSLGTISAAFAENFPTLLAARFIAGAFGGPATSLSYSIIADLVPDERRGKAMGAVMGAFSAATVFGVPIGLELAVRGGWRTPFICVGTLGLLVTAAALTLLPSVRAHLSGRTEGPKQPSYRDLLTRPVVLLSYTMTAVMMVGGFIVLPSVPAYVLDTLHFPRENLWELYAIGGIISFVTMRYVGKIVDRYGSFGSGAIGCALLVIVLYFGFYDHPAWFGAPEIYGALMFAMAFRNVAINTLTSKVPAMTERVRFMSLQSCVQHLASALGATLSSRFLIGARGESRIAAVAIALTVLLPLLMHGVERRVRRPLVARTVTRSNPR
ncbi:MAG: MFS transporter [Clostridia bacterium]|nr:MFS transporter [Deltaproteobacteria bacterium]